MFNQVCLFSFRIFHFGECGLHHNKKKCFNQALINQIKNIKRNRLFPSRLLVSDANTADFTKITPNGGWSDPRDHQLCFQNLN